MCRTGHIAILNSLVTRAWRNRQLDEFEWCWRYLLDPGVRLRTESSMVPVAGLPEPRSFLKTALAA